MTTAPECEVALVSVDGDDAPAWVAARLTAGGVRLVARRCPSPEAVVELAAGADAVWVFGGGTMVTAEILPRLPRCRFMLRSGSGVDNLPVEAARARGIRIGNTPEAIGDTVAEHAVALLLAVVRQIAVQDRATRGGAWDRDRGMPRVRVTGATLGLVGYGRIARAVAHKLSGFDVRVLAFDPHLSAAAISAGGAAPVSLEVLLETADLVSVHCPLLPSTHHLLGEAAFARMKPTSILVNTARGPIVDEHALARALRDGRILGAGLDVLDPEPPNPAHPLFGLDNVVLTPHIAAYSDGWRDRFWDHSVATLLAFARTGAPLWEV